MFLKFIIWHFKKLIVNVKKNEETKINMKCITVIWVNGEEIILFLLIFRENQLKPCMHIDK